MTETSNSGWAFALDDGDQYSVYPTNDEKRYEIKGTQPMRVALTISIAEPRRTSAHWRG
jgi:hypothetical protein